MSPDTQIPETNLSREQYNDCRCRRIDLYIVNKERSAHIGVPRRLMEALSVNSTVLPVPEDRAMRHWLITKRSSHGRQYIKDSTMKMVDHHK